MADEDKELEFASKEDLEAMQKDPTMQKYLNATKAGVTKKFQDWSAKYKTLETRLQQLEDKLYEWQDWYAEAFPEGWNPKEDEVTPTPTKESKREKGANGPTIQEVIEAINKGAAAFEKRLNSLAESQGKLSNAFTLSLDLVEQKFAHPEMDIQKVLKTATEKGMGDLGAAYDVTYRDELIGKQVEEKVATRLKEKEAEAKKTLETGSGSIPLTFEKPKEAPKSFTDATQQFLKERATEGAK
ncbi:MAG: hypothetical protein KKH61_21475 [Gammaproteobacteria bacterium]|nr:hypothetical protein [Gammaproteobacteria bacterium]